jgi:hypothetical protein
MAKRPRLTVDVLGDRVRDVVARMNNEEGVRRGNDSDLLAIIRKRTDALQKRADELGEGVSKSHADIDGLRDVFDDDLNALAVRVSRIEDRAVAGRGFFGRFLWLLTGK